jgi:hypothetical protein
MAKMTHKKIIALNKDKYAFKAKKVFTGCMGACELCGGQIKPIPQKPGSVQCDRCGRLTNTPEAAMICYTCSNIDLECWNCYHGSHYKQEATGSNNEIH